MYDNFDGYVAKLDGYYTVVTLEGGRRVPCHCPTLAIAEEYARGRTLSGVEVLEIAPTQKFMFSALNKIEEGMSTAEWDAMFGDEN